MTTRVSRLKLAAVFGSLFFLHTLSAQVLRTVNVSSSSQLAAAVADARAGDDIVLANGSYSAFRLTADGTASNPIAIRAANRGQATINSGVIELSGTSYVRLEGLTITTSGGSRTTDGETYKMAVLLQGTDHCRITRCTFRLSGQSTDTHWVLLGGRGDANRVDRCEFGPNSVEGHYVWPRGQRSIPGVTPPSDRTSWAEGNGPINPNLPLNTRIDHNYFHDQADGASEVIVLGGLGVTGDYQNYGSIVEDNLFVNCDGDPEFISVKSSGNFVRYNTVRTSKGMISLRAGNRTVVHNNIMLQGGKSGAGGIKIYEKDHTLFNNYIDNASEYPILVGRGTSYTSGFSHAQVFRARIVNNTVVNLNNRPVIMGHGGTAGMRPTDITFANNLIQGSAGTLYQQNETPAGNSVFSSNLASGGSARTGFIIANPQLTTVDGLRKLSSSSPAINAANESLAPVVIEDQDGQARADLDIGADEFSSAPITLRPLTTADVGPNAPGDEPTPSKVATPTPAPAPGTYPSCQSVALSTATPGASLRYTLDGSTPRRDFGTVYTGPIAICSTTTLKAIAYSDGLLDSDVFTGVYTIGTVPPTLNFEAESLARTTSGTSATNDSDANASGGSRVTLNSTGTGSWVQFTLPNIPAGTYSIRMAYKTNNNRGRATFLLDGAPFGPTLDQYASPATYPTATLGTVTFATSGNHTIRLTVASKNSASSSYTLSADKFTLVGQ